MTKTGIGLAELLLIGFAAVALILRLSMWPIGGTLVTISLSVLASFYAILYLSIGKGEPHYLRTVLFGQQEEPFTKIESSISIFSGMAMGTSLMGVLFHLQNWPGAEMQVTVGIIASAVLAAVVLYRNQVHTSPLYPHVLKRLVTILIGVLIFAYLY